MDTGGNMNANNAALSRSLRNGYAALHLAVMYDHEDIVSFLLTKGVPPNLRSLVGGVTALHLAAAHRNVALVQLLLENGAGLD